MDTLQTVVDEAAALLNDNAQDLWNLENLRPFIKKAHRELQVKLDLNGIPVVKKTAATITVPASTTTLPSQPTDLIEPIDLYERAAGTTDAFFPMIERSWEVDATPTSNLNYWFWDQELVQLLGATEEREVRLHYLKGLVIPSKDTDSLGFINAVLFLAPRSAAIAASSIGGNSQANILNQDAYKQLEDIIRLNVKGTQNLGVRRRGYHRMKRRIYG